VNAALYPNDVDHLTGNPLTAVQQPIIRASSSSLHYPFMLSHYTMFTTSTTCGEWNLKQFPRNRRQPSRRPKHSMDFRGRRNVMMTVALI